MTAPLRRLTIRFQPAVIVKRMSVEPTRCRVELFHSSKRLEEKERSKLIGNPHFSASPHEKQTMPKWKVAWLYMMKRKAELEGEEEERPRSDQLNWNYSSELNAFAHRLKIQVHADVLRAAFTEPSAHSEDFENNNDLYKAGRLFTIGFLELYLNTVFPSLGHECMESVVRYLLSEDLLSHVAANLGYRDLVQSPEFPITTVALSRCFLASVAAVLSGPGGKIEAGRFVHDFVASNLIDKDVVHDIWNPTDPMRYLLKELEKLKLPPPDVRLTKRSGVTTVTPIFFVGIFSDGKLLAESGGESVIRAEVDAAKLALKKLYDVSVDRYMPLRDVLSNPNCIENLERVRFEIPEKGPRRTDSEQTGIFLKQTR